MTYIIIVLCLVLLTGLVFFIYKESTGYVLTEVTYTSNKIKKDLVKIAFLSDLHNTQHGEKNIELLRDIEDYNPDFIVFAGDMVTSHMERDYSGYQPTLDFIKSLADKWPVYYGIGNHEEHFRREKDKFPGMYEDISTKLSAMGAPILCDEIIELKEYGITIYGLDLEDDYYRRVIPRKLGKDYLYEKFGKVNPDTFSLLLAHNPEHFDSYANWNPDLVLSGHVHGGIVNVPGLGGLISPSVQIFPKYDAGQFELNESKMLISRGIGSHTLPIRINNKAELIFINLRSE